ncbi:MAG TPA: hypothetical protein VFF06_18110 [Polyangia bacterium]|nr:hypothetical protein [Polyangia bacterium]
MTIRQALALFALAAVAGSTARIATAETPAPAPAAKPAPAPAPTNCKTYGAGKCCDPAVAAHLTKEAVFSSCGESDATFLGEQGSKDTCKYFFKVPGEKDEDMFVQVYAPAAKEVPAAPNDPFFKWGRAGKAFYTEKANSPKSAPMLATSTGLWLPGKGYFVAINASTKVCTKAEAKRLAVHLK